jgi:VWFA-related protein
MAGQSATIVYTVGIFDQGDEDRNPAVLRSLAAATGGEAFFPAKTSDAVAICERIARDIRNQYTLGYVSTAEVQAGAYRAIRAVASGPGRRALFVRTRAGYIADGERPAIKTGAVK